MCDDWWIILTFVSLRGCWTSFSISLVIWLLKRDRLCMSSVRCFCSVWTTGSWRRRHSSVRELRKRMPLHTKWIIPGAQLVFLLSFLEINSTIEYILIYSDNCVVFCKFACCRWLCYCHVPQSNDSLPRYETCQVFGRSLLKSIFTVTRRQLLEKFRVEKDKLPPEKRTLILTHFPK